MAGNGSEPAIYGLPGKNFYVMHSLALCSLALSILSSSTTLIYLLSSHKQSLPRRQIGERLVVYLAIYDLFYSLSHSLDHSYMLATLDNPPDSVCMTFAFFLQLFIMAQTLLVLFTSLNAMSMVVMRKKVRLGSRDWKLFAVTLGLPTIIGAIGVGVPFLGPSGSWCFIDARPSYAKIMDTIYGMTMVVVFAVNVVCYSTIYVKMRRAAEQAASEGQNKYHKAAKLMLLFVAVYLFQWWPYVAQALWSLFDRPPVAMIILVVVLCNGGGVYNAFAYTIIRKKYTSVSPENESTAATQSSIA